MTSGFGPRIFIFSVGDLGEEGVASIQESSLDIGALEEEGPSMQGLEIIVKPQEMSHEDTIGQLRQAIQGAGSALR